MKISELQELLDEVKTEYGDIPILYKDSYEKAFLVKYNPYKDDYLGLEQGFQLYVG